MNTKKFMCVLGATAVFSQMGFADVAAEALANEQIEEMVSADEALLLKKQAATAVVEETKLDEEAQAH
ncbi:MAG: hypothetical protein NT065_02120 [Chlamydiae bacterium]|nr:hypothetical protein [Chlamydiota bacterium]